MGYHNNEETTKKAISDAQKFINDRERYKYLAQLLMDKMGFCDADMVHLLMSARKADFETVKKIINQTR